MNLNSFASTKRLAILEDLQGGREPGEGTFDLAVLREARTKSPTQLGTTRYRPDRITFEYIYPDPVGTAVILDVSIAPPDRIVFLPVPIWVIESIWQGEISGSYQFERDALRLIDEFQAELNEANNAKWFERQQAKRR